MDAEEWDELRAARCAASNERLEARRFQRTFNRMVEATKLPPHHSPHSCRHTFATLLLRAGAPVEYVKRKLGHATITLTADTYGRWLPDSDEIGWTPRPGQLWVDVLDTPASENGSRLVATGTDGAPGALNRDDAEPAADRA